ncbi:hypothetical protein [Streptomyces jeddahensis]|uniref:Uncharacterized protein n=1 Tax=Streptomyces jeddahensis TaxID=1716141 RepID=A0A177HK00_9ACTN|nr:hypothetical protein [Streptomyces jeddahensis]OAH11312.1 hypothetical protein STSP_52600 [Streptomyces jeddahensis]
MKKQPLVVVQAPDDRGLRTVSIQGETDGRAWSLKELRRILRHAGLPPDINLDNPGRVHWVADQTCWPDHPWKRRAAAVVMALGLLTSVAVLLYVGIKDAFNALAYGGRVMGVILLAAALVEIVAALVLWDYWGKRVLRYSGEATLVGVGSVMGTNLMFLVIQIEGGDYNTSYFWLWIGLALWSVWAFWALTRQKVWQKIPHPRTVALGAAVSGIVGAAGLAYSQMFVPYSTPVKVPFGVSIGNPTMSADGAVLHVPTHVEFRNTGSVPIDVVGTMWRVKGYPTKLNTEGNSMREWKNDLWYNSKTLRHVTYSPSRMLGTGEIVDPGARLDPGDDFSKDPIIDVPLKSGIGRVEVYAIISYVRADRGKLGNSYPVSHKASWDTGSKDGKHTGDAPEWVAAPGDEFYRYYSRIYRSSEMLNLTHAEDYASAWWVLPQWREGNGFAKGDTDPYMEVSISPHENLAQTLSDAEQAPYGMKTVDTFTERTIAQLLQASKK